jgi:c-di-GMP-binding flagellar brake protein YcgR
MDIQKSGIDRRRFHRYFVDYPISYSLKDQPQLFTGIAMNLSEGGLLACFFDRIHIGSELDVEMFYTHELQFTSFNVQAQIVWKDIMETSEAIEYQYGLEFIRMDREEQDKLLRLLTSINPAFPYHSREDTIFQKTS